MVNVIEVRNQSRKEALKFAYSITLFDRFPLWVFEYFKSIDPFSSHSSSFTQMEIITIFMFINNINVELMKAFYAAGGQDVDTLFRLENFFIQMWKIYRKTEDNKLIDMFGDFFTFHCETKTLRRVDLSFPNQPKNRKIGNRFVPYTSNWRRDRNTRAAIRNGEFKINNAYDMQNVEDALYDGLFKQGRYHR